jgi:glycosyltransferase involved in cell wall biosynthesis
MSIPDRNDIEIIIVDDNSDAEIVDFENFPGKNANNYKVIFTKEGKGAGYARNQGIKYASGKWLMFADSDDFYEPGAFEILDKNLDSKLDVLFFASTSRNSETLEVSNERRVYSNEMVLNFDEKEYLTTLKIKYHNSAPWNKVIKRKLVINNEIRFDEIKMNNDVFFAINVGKHIQNYKVIKDKLYCFTFRDNSISTQQRPLQEENILLLNRIRTNQFYKSINEKKLCRPYAGILFTIYRRNGLIYFIRYLLFLVRNRNYILKIKNNWNIPELINI